MNRRHALIAGSLVIIIALGFAIVQGLGRLRTSLQVLVVNHPDAFAAQQFFAGLSDEKDPHIQLRQVSAVNKEQQLALLTEMSDPNLPDVLIIHPIPETLPHLHRLAQMGVDVILLAGQETKGFSQWGILENNGGDLAGEALAKHLQGRGSIYFSASTPDDTLSEDRYRAVYRQLSLYPGLRALSIDYHLDREEQARVQVLSVLETHPGVTALVATNALSTRAIRQVLIKTGLSGVIEVIAWGHDGDLIQDVSDGTIDILLTTNWKDLGQRARKALVRYNEGTPLPQEIPAFIHALTSSQAFHLQESQKP